MLLLLWMAVLAGLLLGTSAYVTHQLTSLPYAPACPTCRGMTTHRALLSRMDRLLAHGGADHRHCPRCGWNGRMRWRLAEQRVRRE